MMKLMVSKATNSVKMAWIMTVMVSLTVRIPAVRLLMALAL